MVRMLCLAFALFHLLQATWLLHAGVDLLFPRLSAPSAAADCCAAACGCPEDVRARKACCCPGTAERPNPRRASSIDEARCKGVEAALAQAVLQPSLCAFGAPPRETLLACRLETPDRMHRDLPAALPPDHVPRG